MYTAKIMPVKYLPYTGYLALLPVICFIYIYLTESRKNGVFGGNIWWNNLRPIHSLFYALFAYNAIKKNTRAWIYLLVDVIFGLLSFLIYHYSQGNFSKVF